MPLTIKYFFITIKRIRRWFYEKKNIIIIVLLLFISNYIYIINTSYAEDEDNVIKLKNTTQMNNYI